jgi:arylformamidase
MTTPKDAPDWRGMSRAELDAGFNNVNAVPGALDMVARWDRQSAALRARMGEHLDLRYADRERNRIDVFKAAEGAPTLVFIHGGYWQTRAKESFALFAEGPMAHGINVALIGYTLAPEATLDEIVGEIHAALDCLAARLPGLGCNGAGMVLSGWSAGGHLTAMALGHPAVKAGMAISGLYDLEPIRHCYLNDKLRLEPASVLRNSPMMHDRGAMKPLAMVCGAAELPLLRIQSAAFAGHRAMLGLPVSYEEIAGADHFSIMEQMAKSDGRITALIRRLFAEQG